jgi:NTP pyrophosphatase (non-canonical NTP hydrolase)
MNEPESIETVPAGTTNQLAQLRQERDRLSVENLKLYAALGQCKGVVAGRVPARVEEEVNEVFKKALAIFNTPGARALADVVGRRQAQNRKWGVQNHDPITWSAILSEECGEFAQAALQLKFGGPAAAGLRDEALDCAAVAVQIVEYIDRQGTPAPVVEMKEAA